LQIWGKYSHMGANVTSPKHWLGYDGSLTGETAVNMETFGSTWTINPTMVFDATLGIHPTIAEEFVTMREPAR